MKELKIIINEFYNKKGTVNLLGMLWNWREFLHLKYNIYLIFSLLTRPTDQFWIKERFDYIFFYLKAPELNIWRRNCGPSQGSCLENPRDGEGLVGCTASMEIALPESGILTNNSSSSSIRLVICSNISKLNVTHEILPYFKNIFNIEIEIKGCICLF